MTVEVREPALDDIVARPSSAVDAASTALVLGADDRLEELPVEILRRQGDAVLVRAGALGGREVVTERTPMLGAGISVRPFRPGAVAAGAQDGAGAGAATSEATIALDADRRAALIAFVNDNTRMPAEAKDRILKQLEADEVPVSVVERLESRMGG